MTVLVRKSKWVGWLTAVPIFLPIVPAHAHSNSAATTSDDQPTANAESVQDIVVTAQRRSELLKDVPISVTAVTGEQLAIAGVRTTSDLGMVTPGLQIIANGSYVQPVIRGITTNLTGSPTRETNVAIYLDGVYQNTPVGGVFDLPDVREVEVLKGPQGTLFGRNATGGAILVNSIQPDLNDPKALIDISYGRFRDISGEAFASVPIVQDKLAISVSGARQYMSGFKRNILVPGEKHTGEISNGMIRGRLRFKPSEDVDFILTVLHTDRTDHSILKSSSLNGNNAVAAPPFNIPPSQIASQPWTYSTNEDGYVVSNQTSVSLRGEIHVGPGTLTTTTAYTKHRDFSNSDFDLSVVPQTQIFTTGPAKTFQQELVYSTEGTGPVHALAGVFYYNAKGNLTSDVTALVRTRIVPHAQVIYTEEKNESFAGFGEITFDATDWLSLTAGLRYSSEQISARATRVLGSAIPPATLAPLGEKTYHSATPRFSALFKLSPRTNLYFTYSEGFKSGLFNSSSLQTTPVRPEEVKAFEGGIKSSEIRNLSLSLAGFYYDYTDLQTLATLTTANPVLQVLNAASSTIYGAELSATWRPVPEFSVNGGVTYLHARYDSFPGAQTVVPTGIGGNRVVFRDLAGFTLIRSPTWSGNVTAQYAKEINAGRFDITGTLYYSSRVYHDLADRISQAPYALVNASVGWQAPNSGFELRLWGKNLTNEAVISGGTISASFDGVAYAPPRTYGVEAIYRF